MATTDSTMLTEAELLHFFLGRRLAAGARKESIERLLAEFAEYRAELEKVRALVREAEEASARGESGPLDVDEVIRRGRERMAAEGITD